MGVSRAIEFKPVAQWTWRTESTAIFVAGVIATLPLLVVQVGTLWSMPYLRFFPLAWLCFAYFIWEVPKYGFAAAPLRRYAAVVTTGLGVLLSLVAAIAISPNLSQLAAILILFGWVQLWLGVATFTRLAAISSLMWITWPLPGGLYGRILNKIESTAASTASYMLDLFDVPHYLAFNNLDLRGQVFDLNVLLGSYDSVYSLLFLTILLAVALYRPLFLSTMTILSAPAISWLGCVAKVLLLVWGSEGLSADWTSGTSLVILRIGVFVGECGLLWLVFMGFSILFEPIMVDRSEQINSGVHGLYNRVIVWPLNFAATIKREERPYFDDEVTPAGVGSAKPSVVVRTGPSLSATKIATDPWKGSRWTIGLISTGALASIFGLVAMLLPPVAVSVLPTFSDAQLDAISAANTLSNADTPESLGGVLPLKKGQSGESHVVGWEFASERGAAQFTTIFPTRGFYPQFQGLAGWRILGVPRRFTASDWPGYEVEFVKDSGKMAYGWYTAFDEQGLANLPTKSLLSRFRDRLTSSIFGRMLGLTSDTVSFQTLLLLDSNEPISERAKIEQRSKCIEFTRAVAKKALGGQP